MKVHFGQKTDALYFRLDDSIVMESEEAKPGIVLEFNDKNQVVGIEILDAGKRLPASGLKQMHFEVT